MTLKVTSFGSCFFNGTCQKTLENFTAITEKSTLISCIANKIIYCFLIVLAKSLDFVFDKKEVEKVPSFTSKLITQLKILLKSNELLRAALLSLIGVNFFIQSNRMRSEPKMPLNFNFFLDVALIVVLALPGVVGLGLGLYTDQAVRELRKDQTEIEEGVELVEDSLGQVQADISALRLQVIQTAVTVRELGQSVKKNVRRIAALDSTMSTMSLCQEGLVTLIKGIELRAAFQEVPGERNVIPPVANELEGEVF